MLVEQPRKLGDGHAVAHGHAELADEGLKAWFERRSFNLHPADGIGPVADDDRQAMTRRGPQAVRHGVDEGVDARADVLKVDDEHVDEIEHLLGRLARLAIEREDRHVAAPVLGVRRLDHVVLQVGAVAVLRPEDCGELVAV